ncbi:hypothetical protein BGZ61DRAFT_550775 [Ilyonectria robusta]|uniref:uncharacterized protein n=1 Tax=Ilyonectria robusta TaxID=1079257 RepID=UPI001E8CFD14|nr:uncharacterized protein BGZ61DRAFT_550775 [Ilyonectria robusta]KAH8646446.1 hypothetical protein BGZ61DRAFT_550775 [Ilyonectria robusta]
MVLFNPDKDIPDLSGKIILVTGGNISLGKQTILQLSKHNPAYIFLAARIESKALAAIEDIYKAILDAAPIIYLNLNLISFNTTLASTIKEGYEIQFGINYVGYALLMKILLPTLKKTAAATTPPQNVCIINLSSSFKNKAPATNTYKFDKLKIDMASTPTFVRYGISKIANIHHARALSRRHLEIRSIAVHPGVVNTNLTNGPAATGVFSTNVWNGTKN